jgi:hypothetical protein
MKKIVTLATTLSLISLLSTCTVISHPQMMHKGSGGWGMGGSYQWISWMEQLAQTTDVRLESNCCKPLYGNRPDVFSKYRSQSSARSPGQ